MQKRLECKIEGRVQMVMFRDFTQRNATKLGLMGTVQNMEDGSVFVVAEGDECALQKFLKLLQKGSLFSKVKSIKDIWMEPAGEFSSFNIVYK